MNYSRWDGLVASDSDEESTDEGEPPGMMPMQGMPETPEDEEPSLVQRLIGARDFEDGQPMSSLAEMLSSSEDEEPEEDTADPLDEFRASVAAHEPILAAAVEDDEEAIHLRLQNAPCWMDCLQYDGCHGMPPLHFAVLCGSRRAARALLESGASCENQDATGHTAHAWHLEVCKTNAGPGLTVGCDSSESSRLVPLPCYRRPSLNLGARGAGVGTRCTRRAHA